MYTKQKFILTFLMCFMLTVSSINPAHAALSNSDIDDLMFAYGFVRGNEILADKLKGQFPEFAREINKAETLFYTSPYGQGAVGAINKVLSMAPKDVLQKTEGQILSIVTETVYARDDALALIDNLRARASGEADMPERVIRVFLSENPQFKAHPEREMSAGYVQRYNTKGHPKAKGLDISLAFPITWKINDGERPNVLKLLSKYYDDHGIGCVLMVQENTETGMPDFSKLSNMEIKAWEKFLNSKDYITHANLEVRNGMTVKSASTFTLEKCLGLKLIAEMRQKRLELDMLMRLIQYSIFFGNFTINLQFVITVDPAHGARLNELEKFYNPLFVQVANSLVINNLYKKRR